MRARIGSSDVCLASLNEEPGVVKKAGEAYCGRRDGRDWKKPVVEEDGFGWSAAILTSTKVCVESK